MPRWSTTSHAARVQVRLQWWSLGDSNFSHREARLGDDGCGGRVPQRSTEYAPHPGQSKELTGELMCYARSVAGAEWDAINAGTLGDAINPWGAEMFRTISTVAPKTAIEQSAYDRWMDQTIDRQQARNDRLHSWGRPLTPAFDELPLMSLVVDLGLDLERDVPAGWSPGGHHAVQCTLWLWRWRCLHQG